MYFFRIIEQRSIRRVRTHMHALARSFSTRDLDLDDDSGKNGDLQRFDTEIVVRAYICLNLIHVHVPYMCVMYASRKGFGETARLHSLA